MERVSYSATVRISRGLQLQVAEAAVSGRGTYAYAVRAQLGNGPGRGGEDVASLIHSHLKFIPSRDTQGLS